MAIVALTHSDQQSTCWLLAAAGTVEKCDWWWSDCGGTGFNRHSSAGLDSHSVSELEQKHTRDVNEHYFGQRQVCMYVSDSMNPFVSNIERRYVCVCGGR